LQYERPCLAAARPADHAIRQPVVGHTANRVWHTQCNTEGEILMSVVVPFPEV